MAQLGLRKHASRRQRDEPFVYDNVVRFILVQVGSDLVLPRLVRAYEGHVLTDHVNWTVLHLLQHVGAIRELDRVELGRPLESVAAEVDGAAVVGGMILQMREQAHPVYLVLDLLSGRPGGLGRGRRRTPYRQRDVGAFISDD